FLLSRYLLLSSLPLRRQPPAALQAVLELHERNELFEVLVVRRARNDAEAVRVFLGRRKLTVRRTQQRRRRRSAAQGRALSEGGGTHHAETRNKQRSIHARSIDHSSQARNPS